MPAEYAVWRLPFGIWIGRFDRDLAEKRTGVSFAWYRFDRFGLLCAKKAVINLSRVAYSAVVKHDKE